jgi:hypothetical protein
VEVSPTMAVVSAWASCPKRWYIIGLSKSWLETKLLVKGWRESFSKWHVVWVLLLLARRLPPTNHNDACYTHIPHQSLTENLLSCFVVDHTI